MSSAMGATEFVTHPRIRQWLPTVVNGGMMLLLMASLAQWTWTLIKPPVPPLVLAPPPPPAPTGAFLLQPLLAAHLFGQASQELTGQRLDDLPVSRLNLVLTGVIASGRGGYALISVNGQAQEPFAISRTVTEGAVLQAVYSDRVVIRRNDVLESLRFEETGNAPPQIASMPIKPMPVVRAAYAPVEPARETAGNAQREAEEPNGMMPPEPTAARTSPLDLMKQATLLPSRDGGLTVRLIQPDSVYEKLRVRAGDVIKSVNGQPVNTMQDAIRLYQQIPNVGSVQLEIVRAGKSEFLDYRFAPE